MKTILSPANGQLVPVLVNFSDVMPLMLNGKPVTNGRNEIVFNDSWIYVDGSAINVVRAKFCVKRQLQNTTILSSIGNKKITKNLTSFISEVSENLVFEKNGIVFRVFLKKKGYKYDLSCVKPYYLTDQNIKVNDADNKYLKICYIDKPILSQKSSYCHELKVNLKYAFDFDTI